MVDSLIDVKFCSFYHRYSHNLISTLEKKELDYYPFDPPRVVIISVCLEIY